MGLAAGYDAELGRYNEVLRRAVGVQPHDQILDIGCGAGQTTRQAARAASAGSALGVDVSATAIKRAGDLARVEGIRNVTFQHADAQVHHFRPKRFDVAMSRFGTMFFADPVAAFANIGRALRPAGRLVMMVWQAADRNEWDVEIRRSLGAEQGPVTAGEPDPFSLADALTVREILQAAGFTNVTLTDVQAPVYYGPDVDAAFDWVHGFACTRAVLAGREPGGATRASERLRQALAEHMRDDGVWFDSRAWIVTAQRH